jgi:hypothetical protein
MAHNRIWIELDREAEDKEEQCRLASLMMQKLGVTEGYEFFWSKSDRRFCWGGGTGYTTLTDNGNWFNLDYLAEGK